MHRNSKNRTAANQQTTQNPVVYNDYEWLGFIENNSLDLADIMNGII